MSIPQPSLQERRPADGLQLNLASNNPFRRAASPSASTSPVNVPQYHERPTSGTNPFLDNYQPTSSPPKSNGRSLSPEKRSMPKPVITTRQDGPDNAANLLNGLSLGNERPRPNKNLYPPRPKAGTVPTQGHRPRASMDEEERRIRKGLHDNPMNSVDIWSGAAPDKIQPRPSHARRNSDTSIMEAKDESRRKKYGTSGDGKSREGRPHRRGKPSRRVDVIDKLDVTGFYGESLFHHDGPFDACNPQRNRKESRRAPMRAFAEGSLNNTPGGSGPVNKRMDFEQFHGRAAEGFKDYNTGFAAQNQSQTQQPNYNTYRDQTDGHHIVNMKSQSIIHGMESAGLGTSTFLEGAPVSRSALQKQQAEQQASTMNGAGLSRKKSLAQRLRPRGMSGNRPDGSLGRDVRSPEPQYGYGEITTSPTSPKYVQSAGGRSGMYEVNPFFSELDEKQGQTRVKVSDPDQEAFTTVSRTRTASSPRRGLGRTVTNEGSSSENKSSENKPSGGGFLTRVKSLKGGRRQRTATDGKGSQG